VKAQRLHLTPRQLEAITLLAAGHAPKVAAVRLGTTASSVCGLRNRALKRNGLTNDMQLGMLIERCQSLPVDERNRIEDRREERLDAQRAGAQ
jgi:DNA-binding CsgD family transcriptional regulator